MLELGSGVGIGGITAALVGASSVVLSDFGQPEHTETPSNSELMLRTLLSSGTELDEAAASSGAPPATAGASARTGGNSNKVVEEKLQPRKLLSNLAYGMELNGVEEACSIMRLDWHACLDLNFQPSELFPVIIGDTCPLLAMPNKAQKRAHRPAHNDDNGHKPGGA